MTAPSTIGPRLSRTLSGPPEQLEGGACREDGAAEVREDHDACPGIRLADGLGDQRGVRADGAVRHTACGHDPDLGSGHLPGELGGAFGDARGMGDDDEADVHGGLHGDGRRSFGQLTAPVPWGAPGPSVRSGGRGYSTQSKVRVTAFFHWAYSFSRRSASIFGVYSASFAQFARRSSTSAQKPTARPAA